MRGDGNKRRELGFYYPGQYWHDADWIKNLVLFFDGIAMLIPKGTTYHVTHSARLMCSY